ncbi:MAG: hypothetical protein JXJ04_08615, partial [Spirochaetales bacterium]|nr:hypothetical protein [Spirochaetales bacterium]
QYNLNKFKINNCIIKEGNNLEKLKLMQRYDLAIEGWSFLAAIAATPGQWEKENAIEMLDIQVKNMMRHVKKNGKLIIIESYGTYVNEPAPRDEWVPLYDYLENDLGFTRKLIRTDFKFESVEEAAELFPFFFGEEFKDKIVKEKAMIIPEYTGVFSKDNWD